MNDEHFQARGLFEHVEINGKPLTIPAMMPKLVKTPGRTDWSGPKLGEHNTEVLSELLGLSKDDISALTREKII